MNNGRGAILVTTLWILALLTLLALGIGIKMGVDIKLIGFTLNSSKAHYLAEAGLRKAIAVLEEDTNKYDSLNEVWSTGHDVDDENVLKDMPLGEGSFTVSITDEEGRLNINYIDKEVLDGLPGFSGVVGAVLDWRDGDDSRSEEGAEQSEYDELEVPYECKNSNFNVPEELMLVKGITKDIYEGVEDVITVYPVDEERKKVNINTAPESVLAVLISGVYEELPGKIIEYRNGDDGIPETEDDNVFKDQTSITSIRGLDDLERDHLTYLAKEKKYFKFKSNTFRIISQGEVRGGRVKKTIEAVIKKDKKGSRLLYYYED